MDADDITRQIDDLDAMLRAKLRVRGKTFPERMKRAGRLLPKRVHRAGRLISEAQVRATHPKLARLNDPVAFARAASTIRGHLDTIDPKVRRINMILGVLGGLVFNLLVLCGATLALLRWKGLI